MLNLTVARLRHRCIIEIKYFIGNRNFRTLVRVQNVFFTEEFFSICRSFDGDEKGQYESLTRVKRMIIIYTSTTFRTKCGAKRSIRRDTKINVDPQRLHSIRA